MWRQPFHLTLLDYWQCREIEEFERIEREGERVHLALMIAKAFNRPKMLRSDVLLYEQHAGIAAAQGPAAKARAERIATLLREGRLVKDE